MSIADLRQGQKGGVRALTDFEVPQKAGAWNTLAILADELGHTFARLADLKGPKTERGPSTTSSWHPA